MRRYVVQIVIFTVAFVFHCFFVVFSLFPSFFVDLFGSELIEVIGFLLFSVPSLFPR